MNKQQVETLLRQLLEGIFVPPRLFGELLDILAKSGAESVFLKQLIKNLSILSAMGIEATKHKDFEPIEHGLTVCTLTTAILTSASSMPSGTTRSPFCFWRSMSAAESGGRITAAT